MVYELKQCPEKVNQVSEDYLSDSSFQARRKIYAIGFLLASVLNQKVWMSQTRKDQCPVSWSWAWGEGTSQSEQRHTWRQHITRGQGAGQTQQGDSALWTSTTDLIPLCAKRGFYILFLHYTQAINVSSVTWHEGEHFQLGTKIGDINKQNYPNVRVTSS